MNIREILKKHGIEDSQIEVIATEVNQELPKSFVKKDQYNKKVQSLDELQERFNDLEAKASKSQTNEWEEKYNTVLAELEGLKAKELNSNKLGKIDSVLKEKGFESDKIRKLITKGIDLEKIELAEDGLKGLDVDNIVDEYKDFIIVTEQSSVEPATPPTSEGAEGDPFLAGFNS